jgi:hypothetical protein
VDANVTEITAKARFHESARLVIERLAGGTKNIANDCGNAERRGCIKAWKLLAGKFVMCLLFVLFVFAIGALTT